MIPSIPRGICCIVYVSTSAPSIINGLKSSLTKFSSIKLAHNFVDQPYNRTSFFLIGSTARTAPINPGQQLSSNPGHQLSEAALQLCKAAVSQVNFANHIGTHPTLGSVDHICFSPLGAESLEATGQLASQFASELSRTLLIPTYTYGAASPSAKRLRDVRKELGYFNDDVIKSKATLVAPPAPPAANFGGTLEIDASKGVSTIGAVPLVVNFNMRFRLQDPRSSVLKVTKAVRSELVEALTLPHHGGAFEVACNLLNTREQGPAQVLAVAQDAAESLGLEVADHYCTGPQEEELLAFC